MTDDQIAEQADAEDDFIDFCFSLSDSVEAHPEFEQVCEVSGLQVAASYVTALNCIDHIADGGDDDWLIAIIRAAYNKMGAEGQARLSEQGL